MSVQTKRKVRVKITGTVEFYSDDKSVAKHTRQIKRWIRETLNNEAGFIPLYEIEDGATIEGSTDKATYKVLA